MKTCPTSRRFCRHACLLLLMPVTCAAAVSSNPVRRFDEAVARGLPQRVTLAANRLARGVSGSTLDVSHAIEGLEVTFSDGTQAIHYAASWHGRPAVVTRSGEHLDITVTGDGSVEVTGFSAASDTPHHFRHGTPAGSVSTARTGDAIPAPVTTPPVLPDGVSTVGFYMFVHDALADRLDHHIHAGYVAWWVADIRRQLAVSRVQAIYRRRLPGLTNLATGSDDLLNRWTTATQILEMREGLSHVPGRAWFKFMLLLRDQVAPGVSGRAWFGGDHALASLAGPYTVIAHEFGHTLGGTHEAAEVSWSGYWPCETNLYWHASALRSNCYRFTTANVRRMRDYLAGEFELGGERRFEMVD